MGEWEGPYVRKTQIAGNLLCFLLLEIFANETLLQRPLQKYACFSHQEGRMGWNSHYFADAGFILTRLLSSNWSEKGVLIIAYLAERLRSSATRLRKFSHEIAADMRVIRSGSEGVC